MTPPLPEQRRQTKRRMEQQRFDGACAKVQDPNSFLAQSQMDLSFPFGSRGGAG